ncbi:hypothetical protein QJS10_CPB18g01044 [Acorus calamus]|uniref:Uncharacterized protein n=1 Tax=Acorus calamus TaxID=4465 RepID=A0AAV9CM51_ACOCL|nr:hypothetical protein QJS10_CPB18g01044 [Acorus calamus]
MGSSPGTRRAGAWKAKPRTIGQTAYVTWWLKMSENQILMVLLESIHGSLGPGSWVNFYDEEGRLQWQWNSDTHVGDSEGRRAILGSPAGSIARYLGHCEDPSSPPSTCKQRIKSIVVGHFEHHRTSSEDSCGGYGSVEFESSFCLEDEVFSICGSPQCDFEMQEGGELALQVFNGAADQRGEGECSLACTLSPSTPYKQSSGCTKVCSVGVTLILNEEKGRIKQFPATKSRLILEEDAVMKHEVTGSVGQD